jgi:hypothetical protein
MVIPVGVQELRKIPLPVPGRAYPKPGILFCSDPGIHRSDISALAKPQENRMALTSFRLCVLWLPHLDRDGLLWAKPVSFSGHALDHHDGRLGGGSSLRETSREHRDDNSIKLQLSISTIINEPYKTGPLFTEEVSSVRKS